VAIIKTPAWLYEQFDADPGRDVPAESYNGWKKKTVEIDTDHTALVVMHAWSCGTPDQFPGWYRHVEYLSRANKILKDIFPGLLAASRASPLRVIHVVSGGNYYKKLPGYITIRRLAWWRELTGHAEHIPRDPARQKLDAIRGNIGGQHNQADIKRGFEQLDFPAEARPAGDELIAENTPQLLAACKKYRISHLIYAGFAINWCLLLSPGGMADMTRHGVLCSAIRQATTAVENKETARQELNKESALWRVALAFGFVFDVDDIVAALETTKK